MSAGANIINFMIIKCKDAKISMSIKALHKMTNKFHSVN